MIKECEKPIKNRFSMTTLSEVAAEWRKVKSPSVKLSTMAAYNLILDHHIIPHFDRIEDLNQKRIKIFIDSKFEEGLSMRSVKSIVSVIKMLLRFINDKGLGNGVVVKIELPKQGRIKEVEVFSVKQQKLLISHLKENISLKNLGILLCLNTGLRIGELCALQWKDIDIEKGVININKTLYRLYHGMESEKKTEIIIAPPKTNNSNRIIPLSDYLVEIIDKLKKGKDESCFMLSDSSQPLEPRNYRNHYRQLLRELKLPELKFHSLRHSFATRCIESGCDYKTVSALLGHSDISTTLNLYVHPSFDQKKRCIEKMLKSIND